MTTKEQIRAEIERRITDNTFGAKMELIDLLSFIDTLPEEKPSEDLEKAAEEYGSDGTGFIDMTAFRAFKSGAQLQKEQMMKEAVEAEMQPFGMYNTIIFGRLCANREKVRIIFVEED